MARCYPKVSNQELVRRAEKGERREERGESGERNEERGERMRE